MYHDHVLFGSISAKLNSCLEALRSIVGENFTTEALESACVKADFDLELAADAVLNQGATASAC